MSFRDVRRVLSHENIVYLADRKNAPYGTKTKEELIRLVESDVKRLSEYGCERILIACCTASTVHPHLPKELREISIPIIAPTAKAASGRESIAVIATRHTVSSSAFAKALSDISPTSAAAEIEAGELVTLVESGGRDGHLSDDQIKTIKNIADRIKTHDPDTLILGCTHFSHLEKTFAELLPDLKIISSAREGAMALINEIRPKYESGISRYTE